MKMLIAAGLLAIQGGAVAAELSADNGLEFLVINGKNVKTLGSEGDKRLDLQPGSYQVVARFDDEVKRGSKTSIFTSKPFVFDIDIGNDDMALTIPKLKFESRAAAFFRNPEWELENLTTDSTQKINGVKLTGSGFGSYNNMEKAIAKYNQENGIIFEGGSPQDLEEIVVAIDEKGNVDIKGDTVTQLKLWYTKASTEEKKAFKRWMIDQDL
ncbi:YccT family protein [Enterovibrio nigricans]|uniref:Uncharacterized protein n=1 Tax=Enterovibrio nigricans DSM 22720 TaxID=1121868 RepID=A0A1T4US96_9GAMM|nr:DUF2057 domain-containing protein [Enterovibrio nigricans]PKF51012.1 DUF2057 domain-containing protein [Enterovibrio nigricans]SKA55506.1 hypothetical protein SAMN02745132_02361 [Enterovibrio nigricans DSM 22720]